jgi:hypothetical protein
MLLGCLERERERQREREYLNLQVLIQCLKPKKSHNSIEFLEQNLPFVRHRMIVFFMLKGHDFI